MPKHGRTWAIWSGIRNAGPSIIDSLPGISAAVQFDGCHRLRRQPAF
jgi:hypothetical protein